MTPGVDSSSALVVGEILLVVEGRLAQSPANMDESRVDPILYAWSYCNRGVSLPAVLERGVYRDAIVGRVDQQVQAAKAATHSGVLRRRMPRPVQRGT